MSRGKHAGKNNTFFGEEKYYRSRNRETYLEKNDNEENNIYNDEMKSRLNTDNLDNLRNTSNSLNYSRNYNTNDDFDNNVDNENYDENESYDENEDYDEYDDERTFNIKKIFLVIVIIAALLLVLSYLYKNKFLNTKENTSNSDLSNASYMTSEHEGYKVLGQIKIDKLNITQYILDSTEEKALEKGVGKLYGGSLNNYGNFCIVGHNFTNIFANLSELDVGDTFSIIDKKMVETKYKVKSNYAISPEHLECLQQHDDKIEITLITCLNGSTERIVVKAEKVEQ